MAGKADRENKIENELSDLLMTIKERLGEGKAEDYDIEYDPDSEYVIRATPKQKRNLRLSADVAKVRELLDDKGATIEEALTVFELLGSHIFKAKIAYNVRDYSEMILGDLDGHYDPYYGPSNEPIMETLYFTPLHVEAAELELRTQSKDWLEEKIKDEIRQLSLPDKKAELTRRLDYVDDIPLGRGGDRMEAALKSVQKSVKREMEIEIERITDAKRLNWQPGAVAEPEETTVELDAPNKFTRKEVMALLDDLMPNFKGADNVTKAAFIVKLTPYNGEKNIAQEYSYLRSRDYEDLVEIWKDKFRKSGRGRKKKTI